MDFKKEIAKLEEKLAIANEANVAMAKSLKTLKTAAEPIDERLKDPRRFFIDVVYTSINGNGRTTNDYCFIKVNNTLSVYNITHSTMWGSVKFNSYSTDGKHRKYVQAKDIVDHKGLQFLTKLREKT